eukprot:2619055-Pleurochrysis_carterae.AAC.4
MMSTASQWPKRLLPSSAACADLLGYSPDLYTNCTRSLADVSQECSAHLASVWMPRGPQASTCRKSDATFVDFEMNDLAIDDIARRDVSRWPRKPDFL